MTREMLEDLVRDAPQHVVADIGAAWTAGARRRRRGFVVRAAAAAAAAVVLAVGVLGFDPVVEVAPTDGPGGVDSHPSSIPKPVLPTRLPKMPGALAGALQLGDGSWLGVSSSGGSWRLPAAGGWSVAISDNGTRLGYFRSADDGVTGHYETVDLTTGDTINYHDIGTGTFDGTTMEPTTDQPFRTFVQTPGFWSPDGSKLLIYGDRVADPDGRALVLDGGAVTVIDREGYPAGWVSPTTIAWLSYDGAIVTLTDTKGALVREVALDVSGRLRGVSQWSARVAPGGGTLAVAREPASGMAVARTFDLGSGAVLSKTSSTTDPADVCGLSWASDAVAVWSDGSQVELESDAVMVTADPRWGETSCATWASNALAGPASDGPGATQWRYWGMWWHWQKILVGLLVIGFVGGISRLDRRNRRRAGEAA
jgi:hypothetical protein